MIHKKSNKVWHDHRGNEVPREYVPEFDQKQEAQIGKIYNEAQKLSDQLADFKVKSFMIADEMYAQMLRNAKIDPTDRKGNYSLTSFDKSVKVEVNVSDRIDFDENITMAQEKLNQFIRTKTEGADQDLAALVNQAFPPAREGSTKPAFLGCCN